MKPLHRVVAREIPARAEALQAALEGGPAVWPVPDATAPGSARAIPDPDRATLPDHATNPDTVPDEIALVVETSGSTAAPKRVMLSASALRSSCTGVVS